MSMSYSRLDFLWLVQRLVIRFLPSGSQFLEAIPLGTRVILHLSMERSVNKKSIDRWPFLRSPRLIVAQRFISHSSRDWAWNILLTIPWDSHILDGYNIIIFIQHFIEDWFRNWRKKVIDLFYDNSLSLDWNSQHLVTKRFNGVIVSRSISFAFKEHRAAVDQNGDLFKDMSGRLDQWLEQ